MPGKNYFGLWQVLNHKKPFLFHIRVSHWPGDTRALRAPWAFSGGSRHLRISQITESQNYLCWKSPLRPSNPPIPPVLSKLQLIHIPKSTSTQLLDPSRDGCLLQIWFTAELIFPCLLFLPRLYKYIFCLLQSDPNSACAYMDLGQLELLPNLRSSKSCSHEMFPTDLLLPIS